jgi:hypothetical protein
VIHKQSASFDPAHSYWVDAGSLRAHWRNSRLPVFIRVHPCSSVVGIRLLHPRDRSRFHRPEPAQ